MGYGIGTDYVEGPQYQHPPAPCPEKGVDTEDKSAICSDACKEVRYCASVLADTLTPQRNGSLKNEDLHMNINASARQVPVGKTVSILTSTVAML
jgi:hypothetical protein